MHDPELRVTDAERQAVVDRLAKAVGDGLLTLDEFADHAGRCYAAITRGDLDDVTSDLRLPVMAAPPPPPAPAPAGVPSSPELVPPPKRRWIVAIMGGEERKGRWRASRRMGAIAFMGGVELDLRDALLEDDEVEIVAWALMGGVTIIVPEGIPVESSGFLLMGGRTNRIKDVPPVPGAPVVRIRGYGMWGGVDVRSKPSRDEQAAQRARREEEHRARREEHRARRMERHGYSQHRMPPPPFPPPPAEPEAPPGLLPQGGLVTIVCTDLVGSTRWSDQLGDQRWRALLGEHNDLVRKHLAMHGGHEVKTRGDGFLCTFASARRAVAFAAELQDALAEWRTTRPSTPLEVRVGVHAGEVERDGDDVVGRNVSLTCRLCDAAAPGEVLVSAVVADLADSSSDLAFGPERTLALAGLERPVIARPASKR